MSAPKRKFSSRGREGVSRGWLKRYRGAIPGRLSIRMDPPLTAAVAFLAARERVTPAGYVRKLLAEVATSRLPRGECRTLLFEMLEKEVKEQKAVRV